MNRIVIDGHDFSGKNELIHDIMVNIDNSIVINPFKNNIGELFLWLYSNRRYNLACELSINSICKEDICAKENSLIIYNSHWVTVFSVFPKEYWHKWYPLPNTIICWAPASQTLKNMEVCGNKELIIGYTEYYCDIYKKIAQEFNCKLIDTSVLSREEALQEALQYIREGKESQP